MSWAQKQAHQHGSPWGVWNLGPQLMCSSSRRARSLFHLLANWFHLYLRKDKELCSGNVSLCSQALFLSSWWTGMGGMHLLAGIWWCPGTNGSHILTHPLSTLGEKQGGRGCSVGRGCKQAVWVPASCCLSMNSDNGIWLSERGSQECACGGGEVTGGRWGKPSLQVRNELWEPSLPWVYSPKEGRFPALTVSQTQLYPNCDAWQFLCFCL